MPDQLRKSVDLGNLALRPLPTEMFGKVSCVHCLKKEARWEMGRSGELAWNYACSKCLMYSLPLFQEQRASVETLIGLVEAARKEVFERDEDNRISHEKADLVLFGIVLADRIMRANRKGPRLNAD